MDEQQEEIGHEVHLEIQHCSTSEATATVAIQGKEDTITWEVDEILRDLDYYELTGKTEQFDTFACAVSTHSNNSKTKN